MIVCRLRAGYAIEVNREGRRETTFRRAIRIAAWNRVMVNFVYHSVGTVKGVAVQLFRPA